MYTYKPWKSLGDSQKHCRRRIDETFLDDVLINWEDNFLLPHVVMSKITWPRTYLTVVCHCQIDSATF